MCPSESFTEWLEREMAGLSIENRVCWKVVEIDEIGYVIWNQKLKQQNREFVSWNYSSFRCKNNVRRCEMKRTWAIK